MLDFEREIASDLSAIHRIDDPDAIGSSRYFELALFLGCYAGAVQARFRQEIESTAGSSPSSEASPAEEVRYIDDPRALEALTNQNGFAGFEYAGGD